MPTVGAFGERTKRVEDGRFLVGQGQYVDDVKLPNTLDVAFVRSTYAHAKIVSIDISKALAHPGVHRIMTGEEAKKLCKPIRVEVIAEKFPAMYKPCNFYAIAIDKVNFVGDIVAAVVATNRYVAEDAAELVEVTYDPLEPVIEPEKGMLEGAPLIHEEWGDNIMLATKIDTGGVDKAFQEAAVTVSGRFQLNRQCAAAMENRAVIADYDRNRKSMTVWSSSQMPHMVRSRISELIGFPEHSLRVISPDVGGGFGLKACIFPEELVLALLTRELQRPIRWIEDRRENFYGSYHAKDDLCYGELALTKDGIILAAKGKFIGDTGAYTVYPWTPCFEPVQAALAFPGPYKIKQLRVEALAVATNKVTTSPYRGVGLPAAQYTMEHLMDFAAKKLGMDPVELRRRNIMCIADFPHTTPTGLAYDSASPLESLEMAVQKIEYDKFRKEQAEALKNGKYLGIGFSSMIEITTFGFDYWHAIGFTSVSGYDSAHLIVDPKGGVTLSVGTHSHGQGHATVYAQLVADGLGCKVEDVTFIQGDTAMTPYGWGTWGSRSAVAGGGAVINATSQIREKMFRVAANLMEVSPRDLEAKDGKISVKGVPSKNLTLSEVAHAAVYTTDLPEGEEPGLEAHNYYKAPTPYANATHVAVVEVDPATGFVKIVRYLVVEDCGRMINPMIVEGQISGGVAQGIGQALFEHHIYDESGQILTTSLMDYLIPTATDIPAVEFAHLETPCPISVGGIKGMGEGGAVAPPPAIANAICDALSSFGWRTIDQLPMSPEVVHALTNPRA
jgi:carbon-monoxide dehydrogenase large subunit